MTIHKSQGSEFDRVHMLLPGNDATVLTRELIYTGITRAKEKVDIWGSEEIFVSAVARRIDRKSGLREALWSSSE
jgi:exodeoxyribonuclease V alpha subunit